MRKCTFAEDFSEELAHREDNRGMHGYIDKTGRIVIELKFLAAGPFSEGLAPVRLYRNKKAEAKDAEKGAGAPAYHQESNDCPSFHGGVLLRRLWLNR